MGADMKTAWAWAGLAAAIGAGYLVGQEIRAREIVAVNPADIQWEKAGKAGEGIWSHHVSGSAAGGAAVDLIKFAKGAKVPLHYHSANHVVTVVSGRLVIGKSGAPSETGGMEVAAGGYYTIPARSPH